ncbi:unnamed protein product [Parajaminaea phylloscopi]
MEMSYGIPFLLELGLSKPSMAIVFIAGPISGLVVQPVVGVLADASTHPWGRRRPFMLAASAVCCFFLFLVGYARVLPDALSLPSATPFLAVVGVWGMDFAVNAVMAVDRSLIFDMLPAEEQAAANAWSMRMSAFGAILGFYVGDVDLPAHFPFSWLSYFVTNGAKTPTEPQVRCLSLITVFCLMASHLVVAWAAVESRLEPDTQSRAPKVKPFEVLVRSMRDFLTLARQLPESIKRVFRIQIASWVSWFPLMFYTTAWVSSIAVEEYRLAAGGHLSEGETWDQVQARGTRAGSHALFLQAVVAFACSAVLPMLLPGPVDASPNAASGLSNWSHRLSALPRVAIARIQSLSGKAGHSSVSPGQSAGVSLTTLWVFGHALLVLVTWLTWPMHNTHSLAGATAIIAISGYSWAVSSWAPFAIIGILIQRDGNSTQTSQGGYEAVPMRETNEGDDQGNMTSLDGPFDQRDGHGVTPAALQSAPSPGTVESGFAGADVTLADQTSARTGSILGLHNTAIVIPQMVVSLIAAAVFAVFDDPRGEHPVAGASSAPPPAPKFDVVGLMIRIGGLASILAAWWTWQLRRDYRDVIDACGDLTGEAADSIVIESEAAGPRTASRLAAAEERSQNH